MLDAFLHYHDHFSNKFYSIFIVKSKYYERSNNHDPRNKKNMSDCDKIEASCTIPQSRKRKVQQENGKWTESETTLLIYVLARNECFWNVFT